MRARPRSHRTLLLLHCAVLLLLLLELSPQAIGGKVALRGQGCHAAAAGRSNGLSPLCVVQVAC